MPKNKRKSGSNALRSAFGGPQMTPRGDGVVSAPPTGKRTMPSASIMQAFNIGQDPLTTAENPVNAMRAREKKRRQAMGALSGSFATRPEDF
jgi:hypothetical protein